MLAWICATEASVWVILSTSVACEAENEAVVAENVRTVSMRARKSLEERVMYYRGCVEVLGPIITDREVGMWPEVCGEVEGIGACDIEAGATEAVAGGAEETGGDTGEIGARGSLVCSAIGDKSLRGLSAIGFLRLRKFAGCEISQPAKSSGIFLLP